MEITDGMVECACEGYFEKISPTADKPWEALTKKYPQVANEFRRNIRAALEKGLNGPVAQLVRAQVS